MSQIFKTDIFQAPNKGLESLKEEYNSRQEIVIPEAVATTRVVAVEYKSCCGCGCSWMSVKFEVPQDAKVKDGDRITSYENDWKWLS